MAKANQRRKVRPRSEADQLDQKVWLFRYYSWQWFYLGPRGEDGYFKHQERPRMPLVGRQEVMCK